MNWKRIKNKLFPSGILAFVLLEILSLFLGYFFSSPFLSYLGYILVLLYIFYLIFITSENNRIFSVPVHIQWIVLLIVPTATSLCAVSYLKISSPISKITFGDILIQEDTAIYISILFFLSALIVWSCLILIKHFINRDTYFAYAATCIPIKSTSTETNITLCLIENRSHNESAWMFPGGHVDLAKNYYNEKDTSLSNVSIIPEKIVRKKAIEEAGLEELKFISLSDFRGNVRQLETGWSLNAPAFNYLFKVNDSANCHSILHHRVHLDFTYVATYKKTAPNSKRYNTYEFELSFDKLPKGEKEAISTITHQLQEKLNERSQSGESVKAAHDLFPDSIPEMIYCACKYYQAFLKIQKP
ncbi:MAG: hypothetical protein ACI4F2_10610 [Acutalibacteraceae bacterium]